MQRLMAGPLAQLWESPDSLVEHSRRLCLEVHLQAPERVPLQDVRTLAEARLVESGRTSAPSSYKWGTHSFDRGPTCT